MKKIKILLLFILIFTVAYGYKWEEVNDENGNFTILFPEKPLVDSQNIETEIGNLTGYMFFYEDSINKKTFLLMYTEFPSEIINQANIEDLLKATLKGQISGIDGTKEKEETIFLNQRYPGIKGIYYNKNFHFFTNIYLIENKLFQILAVTPDKSKKDMKVINKFLNSFDLLK